MKPLIGVTCNYDYRDAVGMVSDMGTAGQDWNFVAGDYVYMLEQAGAVPVLIPQWRDLGSEDMEMFLGKLDGVLLSGGHDVGPECYGAPTKAWCGLVMPMRDRQDLQITKICLEKKIPLLGICRGLQILNVCLGGNLYQDLQKEGTFETHSGGSKYPRNYGWHPVTFEPGSLMERIYGKTEIRVNSFHHQAAREPGNGLKVTGWSPDGVIEAVELREKPFMAAVQWHPEMMYDSEEQMKLMKAFVEACK